MHTTFWALIDAIARLVVIFYPGLIAFWLIIHSRIEHWRKVGKGRAYGTACLPWPVIAAVLGSLQQELFAYRWRMPSVVIALGFVALAWAFVTGYQASREIPHRTLIGLAEIEPDSNRQPLLAAGIYSRTRNPVYFTHFLVILFTAMTTGYVASWALIVLVIVGDALMIRAEERELKARFGAPFEEYMRRVPRFVPRRPW